MPRDASGKFVKTVQDAQHAAQEVAGAVDQVTGLARAWVSILDQIDRQGDPLEEGIRVLERGIAAVRARRAL